MKTLEIKTKMVLPVLLATITVSWMASAEENAAVASAEPSLEIRLRPNALVRGLEFTIGEVADLGPEGALLAEQVRHFSLGRSPMPGYTQRVKADVITNALQKEIKDLSAIRIAGMESCAVTIASVKIEDEIFQDAARKHLLQQLPWREDQIEITCQNKPKGAYVPIGTGNGPVIEITNAGEQKQRGLIRLQIRVLTDGQVVYQAFPSFNVRTFQDVIVAVQNIARNSVITEKDVTIERREVTDLSFGFFTRVEDVAGKKTDRDIATGFMLNDKQLTTPPVISRKTMVTILYEASGLKISLKGIAEDAGAPGEIIRVRSLQTHRQLYAKVLDASTVLVASAQ